MKYNIHKDFSLYSHFHAPMNKFSVKIAPFLMKLTPKHMFSSKRLEISSFHIKSANRFIKIYQIKPRNIEKMAKCIIIFHGGGFIFKAPYHYRYAKKYALETNSIVYFVEYTLGYKYDSTVLESDCINAYKYIYTHGDELSIDKNRIMLEGDSAGGYLAINTFLKCKERNFPTPKCLLLIYPVVDNLQRTKSMLNFRDTPVWDSQRNGIMWEGFLKGRDVISPLDNLEREYPITYIEVCEFDCLHDEGVKLYQTIKDASFAFLNETKGTIHGYDMKRRSKIVEQEVAKRIEFINNQL